MFLKFNAVLLAALLTVASLIAPHDALAAGRKYHPGHYAVLFKSQSDHRTMLATLKPGLVGFVKRYTWRSLEPTPGNYDLSEIREDLNWTAAYGMRLIVLVEDKTFVAERSTPAYLDAYAVRNTAGGYTPMRWHPYVVGRMNLLMKALGRFDRDWNFEGVATQETALSLTNAALDSHGYTPEKLRDAYISILSTAAASMPTSRVFWYMNFIARNNQYIAAVANAVAAKGVVMGGPDVMPDNKALVDITYPFYDQFRSKMPLFGQVEPICYEHLHKTSGYRTKYWTMPELFRYARDELHVDYMFWVRLPKPSPWDSYAFPDALPVIANNPTFHQ
jgi:hypothetical protein